MRESGQSLLEVLVAVGVAILLVTGLLVGSSSALSTTQYGERRSLAIKYAQEGIELTRALRDRVDDSVFIAYDTNPGPPTKWCLDGAGVYTAGPTCSANVATIYTRSVSFDWDPATTRMRVKVVVAWTEAGQIRDVTLDTFLTQWR